MTVKKTAAKGAKDTDEKVSDVTTSETEAKAKADAEAKAKASKGAEKVRVICEGTLGPKLLKKGDVTDDPVYLAILKQKGQKKVEEVK